MGRPTSAEVYFQRVLEQYPQSSWSCRAGIGLGQTLMKRRQWAEALAQLERVIDACPDPEAAKKGRELMEEARNAVGKLAAAPATAPPDTAGAPDSASAP
jgi:TolA-binding protein